MTVAAPTIQQIDSWQVQQVHLPGAVWCVLPAAGQAALAIEVRSRQTQPGSAGQHWVGLWQPGQPLRLHLAGAGALATLNPWWTSLAGALPGVLLLHSYPQPGQPGRRGLLAIDAARGTLLWQHPSARLVQAGTAGVLVYTDGDHTRQAWLHPATGKPLAADPAAAVFAADLLLPAAYTAEGLPPQADQMLQLFENEEIATGTPLEWLEGEGFGALACYYPGLAPGRYTQRLRLARMAGQGYTSPLSLTLVENEPGLALDSYMVWGEPGDGLPPQLIAVQGRASLTLVGLGG